MNKLVQVVLCVVFAAAVSAKPGFVGVAPYAAHHVAALAAAEHSGAYIHDPSGDLAVPYIHDPSGDFDYANAPVIAAVHPYAAALPVHAAALPYAAAVHGIHGIHGIHGVHALPAPVLDTPAVAAAKAAHFAAHAAAAHGHLG